MGASDTKVRRKEARPSELIEAGLQEFALNGFAGTRLEDVAKRAGVVKGTIYRYFKDKESLFLATVRSKLPPFISPVEDAIDHFPGTTQELLQFLLSQAYENLVGSELFILVKIIIMEGNKFPALTEFYYGEFISRGRALLDKILARGIARGEVRPEWASFLSLTLISPVIMAALWRQTFHQQDPITTESFQRAHLALLFDGVFTKPTDKACSL